jgi:hypothetical protein
VPVLLRNSKDQKVRKPKVRKDGKILLGLNGQRLRPFKSDFRRKLGNCKKPQQTSPTYPILAAAELEPLPLHSSPDRLPISLAFYLYNSTGIQ